MLPLKHRHLSRIPGGLSTLVVQCWALRQYGSPQKLLEIIQNHPQAPCLAEQWEAQVQPSGSSKTFCCSPLGLPSPGCSALCHRGIAKAGVSVGMEEGKKCSSKPRPPVPASLPFLLQQHHSDVQAVSALGAPAYGPGASSRTLLWVCVFPLLQN